MPPNGPSRRACRSKVPSPSSTVPEETHAGELFKARYPFLGDGAMHTHYWRLDAEESSTCTPTRTMRTRRSRHSARPGPSRSRSRTTRSSQTRFNAVLTFVEDSFCTATLLSSIVPAINCSRSGLHRRHRELRTARCEEPRPSGFAGSSCRLCSTRLAPFVRIGRQLAVVHPRYRKARALSASWSHAPPLHRHGTLPRSSCSTRAALRGLRVGRPQVALHRARAASARHRGWRRHRLHLLVRDL